MSSSIDLTVAAPVEALPHALVQNSIRVFTIAMLQRNREIFDIKLLNSLSQFVSTTRGPEGATFLTIVGDLYDSVRVRLALRPYDIHSVTDRELQGELAAFVQRLSFAQTAHAPIADRDEARALAVAMMDRNTIADIIRGNRVGIDDNTLNHEVHHLFLWEADGRARGPRVPDEDEATGEEVVVLDGVLEAFFVLLGGRDARLVQEVLDAIEVFLTSLELRSAIRDEIFGGLERGSCRGDEGSFGEIKGEDGFNPVGDIVGRVARRLLDGNALGPEHGGQGWAGL
ncbi:hypothetical protein DFP72DRAFT_863322 [Ephemerocybe angulata]|uniref:Uncharacterized protein n=1 Tax=Ephemerocybe angulata TaxID=980116 RepID=A0A8H6H5T0_9AGAR|nr:hypothetical protein DFP72DRAFT_863322 [Tulosesus angulatus]